VPVLLGDFGRYRQRSIDTEEGLDDADDRAMTDDMESIGGCCN